MTAVRKLRQAINETADRWESAAVSLETCVASSRTAMARRIKTLKQNAILMAERLGAVLEEARELSPEARVKTVRDINQFKESLSGDGLVGEISHARKEAIESARRELEERLERIADDVHPDFNDAVSAWVRAQMEFETCLELAAQRFVYEQAGWPARAEARKHEMLESIEQFRDMLNERRFSATRRGRPFGSEMNAAWLRICHSFQCLSG